MGGSCGSGRAVRRFSGDSSRNSGKSEFELFLFFSTENCQNLLGAIFFTAQKIQCIIDYVIRDEVKFLFYMCVKEFVEMNVIIY